MATEMDQLEQEIEAAVNTAIAVDIIQRISIILTPILLLIILIVIIRGNKQKQESIETIEKKLYKLELIANSINTNTGKIGRLENALSRIEKEMDRLSEKNKE